MDYTNDNQDRPAGNIVGKVAAGLEGAAEGLREGLVEFNPVPAVASSERQIRTIRLESDGFDAQQAAPLAAKLDDAKDRVHQAAQRTRDRIHAVRESASRAKVAPAHISHEMKEAGKAYAGGVAASLAMWAATGLFAFCMLCAITVGLIVGLGAAVGSLTGGAFLTALLYACAAGITYALARGATKAGREKAAVHMRNARQEARGVAQPLRDVARRPDMARRPEGQRPARPARRI